MKFGDKCVHDWFGEVKFIAAYGKTKSVVFAKRGRELVNNIELKICQPLKNETTANHSRPTSKLSLPNTAPRG